MGLFDSGMVNFIKLLIIIGLISMLYMIVMQKIKEQNHKITSLLSVVSSMAIEITNLKSSGVEPVYEKIDICNDSDSEESESDTGSDDDTKEDINFFEINETQEVESDIDNAECEIHETQNEISEISEICEISETLGTSEISQTQNINYNKLTLSRLLEMAIQRNLVSKEEGSKMKKKDLVNLFS